MMATLLTIGLPSLTVLVGILLNRDAVNSLRTDMNGLRGEMSSLRSEMVALCSSFHSDVLMLLERDAKLASRVAQLKRAS